MRGPGAQPRRTIFNSIHSVELASAGAAATPLANWRDPDCWAALFPFPGSRPFFKLAHAPSSKRREAPAWLAAHSRLYLAWHVVEALAVWGVRGHSGLFALRHNTWQLRCCKAQRDGTCTSATCLVHGASSRNLRRCRKRKVGCAARVVPSLWLGGCGQEL